MKPELEQSISTAIASLYDLDVVVELTRPEEQFGDYATNIALQLAGRLQRTPREIAAELAAELGSNLSADIQSVDIAGPGFLNLRLTDGALRAAADMEPAYRLDGQSWVIEYSCPNAFKELHTGHLYNTIAGDIIARLVERAGANVHRTSFGGDVGLHVAKCLWGILQQLGGTNHDNLVNEPNDPLQRASWISDCYVAGAAAYESGAAAKQIIVDLNQAVYRLHAEQDHDSPLAQIYWQCRQWSFDYFNAFYKLIDVPAMRYYPESETAELGMACVKEQLTKGRLEKSDGAVVYKGDETKHLHTRVFVTSKGLPTYETKDVGVILSEQRDYNYDRRVLLTGNDQTEYMRVVFAAMDDFIPGSAAKMQHLTNGTVRFGDGKKMSSRQGNVTKAVDVLSAVKAKAASLTAESSVVEDVTLGAVKYTFASHRLGGDIAFNVEESVSLEGNSGPYLQYAHARARSILAKADLPGDVQTEFRPGERSLLCKLGEYAEVVDRATAELMPSYICTYLYELAQAFNRFYEQNRVIGDPREAVRLTLVQRYADILKRGLGLLGISAPDSM